MFVSVPATCFCKDLLLIRPSPSLEKIALKLLVPFGGGYRERNYMKVEANSSLCLPASPSKERQVTHKHRSDRKPQLPLFQSNSLFSPYKRTKPMADETSKGISIEELESPVQQQKRTNYLLAIGIDDYQHVPKLYNCVKDVNDLIEVLTNKYLFEKKNIKTLFNEKATRRNIYQAFMKMAETLTADDNLIVYFSGHGEYNKIIGKGYWIPVNAEERDYSQYFNNSEIKDLLSAIKSHHTFLISDSCFSGALFAKGLGKNVSRRYEKDPSRWGLTAGRNEIVSDGKPGDNSPFAESLLYRLKNTDKPIGVAELCAHVTEYVQANSNQTPIGEPLKVEGHKNGQFVFHLKNQKSEAQLLWEKIGKQPENTTAEINQKIRLAQQYIRKHKKEGKFAEAVKLGEYLEQKAQFFKAKKSFFSLSAFAEMDTPFREEAIGLLDKMNEPEPPKEKEKPKPKPKPVVVKKTAEVKLQPPTPQANNLKYILGGIGVILLAGMLWMARSCGRE